MSEDADKTIDRLQTEVAQLKIHLTALSCLVRYIMETTPDGKRIVAECASWYRDSTGMSTNSDEYLAEVERAIFAIGGMISSA